MITNLYQYLEKSAKQFPSRKAISCKEENMTYKNLEKCSNRLASSLSARGIKNGDRIGIYLGKSIEMVVAVYATLKLGAIYVPLDPLTPTRRIGYIFSDCDISCLITNQKRLKYIEKALIEYRMPKLIVVTDDKEEGLKNNHPWGQSILSWKEAINGDNKASSIVPPKYSDVAYILYTSGSTGQPKGVMLSHGNAIAFVNWATKCFQISEYDRLSNHALLHFDLSVFDLYASAKAGGTVLLVPEELVGLGSALVDFIVNNGITIWYSVPSILIRILTSANAKSLHSSNLRLILFAGEVFPIKYLRLLHDMLPGVDLYNLYGPTETNVCTHYKVQDPDLTPDRKEPVPIGKPCEYAKVFTINTQGRLVGSDEVGELYISGPTVMVGYWGDLKKTSDSLIRCPSIFYTNEPFYRTGDLVRRDKLGNYIFIGRRDSMIKSRGYRIELGEIETILFSHPAVHEVAVVSIPNDVVGNRINAYVALNQGEKLSEGELVRYCSQHLPRYMIPEKIMVVNELPRTSTGKVDRQTLKKM